MEGQIEVITCPVCNKKYRNDAFRFGFMPEIKMWSDGFRANDAEHEKPLISRCNECYSFFWINGTSNLNSEKNHPVLTSTNDAEELKTLPDLARLTAEVLAEALSMKKYKNPQEEELLRTRLWWRINDQFRNCNAPQISPELKSLFEENLETLIYKTPVNSTQSTLKLAEMHRELGNFSEAEHLLNLVNDPRYDQVLHKMRRKIALRDKVVFLL